MLYVTSHDLFINLFDLEPPGIMHEVHIQSQPQNQGIINQLLDQLPPAVSGDRHARAAQPSDCCFLQCHLPCIKWERHLEEVRP